MSLDDFTNGLDIAKKFSSKVGLSMDEVMNAATGGKGWTDIANDVGVGSATGEVELRRLQKRLRAILEKPKSHPGKS